MTGGHAIDLARSLDHQRPIADNAGETLRDSLGSCGAPKEQPPRKLSGKRTAPVDSDTLESVLPSGGAAEGVTPRAK